MKGNCSELARVRLAFIHPWVHQAQTLDAKNDVDDGIFHVISKKWSSEVGTNS
jgi:hypothetical protein